MGKGVYGYAGKILRVDLSKEKLTEEDLSKQLMMGYIGGRGINIKILYDEVKLGVEPQDPENRVIFGAGPLVGTLAPSCSRWNVSARSPMTGLIGDSNAGGHWSSELKWSGYDHVVFHGKAKKPVFLWINDGVPELRDARHVWGKTVSETGNLIREEVDEEEAKVACIGPAGENLVMGGAVISDGARAAARTGIASVMGIKNLKGIAVVGTKGVQLANPEKFQTLCEEAYHEILDHDLYDIWSQFGTTFLLRAISNAGRLAIKNWTENVLPEGLAEALSAETLIEKYVVKSKGCFNCPVSCSHIYSITDGPYAGTFGEGPEYEAQVHLGSNLGISNLEAVLHMNMLCNEMGLDVCTAGASIAWAMECYEKGILTEEDTHGLRLNWGNEEVAVDLIKKIAHREGFGAILADGPYLASKKLGKGSRELVVTKGMPWTAVDARGSFGWALAYSTSTRGADHLRALVFVASLKSYQDQAAKIFGVKPAATDEWELEGKPFFVKLCEEFGAIVDSLGICKTPSMCMMIETYFVTDSGKPDKLADLFSAATGFDLNGTKLLEMGERIYNVEKAFNCRFGFGERVDDRVPTKFMEDIPPFPPRDIEKSLVTEGKLKQLLDEYYELRGWDIATGLPTREKLEELGLNDVADELDSLDKLGPR